eukprot:scaffold2363_cov159-Amphora_coffeaeformis.AAC.19
MMFLVCVRVHLFFCAPHTRQLLPLDRLILQVAGQIQGLLPGDLGDLGDASFTLRWIEDSIDMLISKYNDVSDGTGVVETRLNDSRLKHLQLVAHLLACGQRLFLCEAELETDALLPIMLKVVDANLTRLGEAIQPKGVSEDLPMVAPEIILQSPFWRTILIPLLRNASRSPKTLLENTGNSTHYGNLLAALEKACNKERAPSVALMRHLLQIVSVCASVYPAGACWMTTSHSSWYELPLNYEEEKILDTQAIIPPRCIQGSSMEDLAIILNVVSGIMAFNGDITGDTNLQIWATRTLDCLALPTSFISVLCEKASMHEVQTAWRAVWSIIFRKDLRYHSSTNDCSVQSHGEAVASLVASVAQNMCVDIGARWSNDLQVRHTSFLVKRQSDVWNLPLFTHSSDDNLGIASRVVRAVVKAVGLTEDEDSIGHDQKEFSREYVEYGGRRGRLINFFLFRIFQKKKEVVEASSACLASLAYGSNTCGQESELSSPFDTAWGFCELTSTTPKGEWKNLPLTVSATMFPLPSTLPVRDFRAILKRKEAGLSSADLVGESTQKTLAHALFTTFRASFDAFVAQAENGDVVLQQQLSVLEVMVTLLKNSPKIKVAENYEEFCGKVGRLTKHVKTSILSSSPPKSTCFQRFAGILKGLIWLGAAYDLPLPDCITTSGDELYAELLGILSEYPKKDSAKPRASTAMALDSDDEELPEDRSSRKNSGRLGRGMRTSPSKRQNSLPSIIARLQPMDVFVCADIVLALRPTSQTLKKVVRGLTGAEVDRLWVLHADELDSAALLYIMWLLVNHTVRYENDEMESVVTISLNVMKAIKRCGVFTADTTEYCLCCCFQIFQQRLKSDEGGSLSSAESSDLLALLTEMDPVERRTRNLRPTARVESARLASNVFLQGGSDLRDQWGKAFPSLVLPGMCDSNGLARRQSSYSVSQCLSSTVNQTSVIESTLRNMYIPGTGQKSFKEWYKSFSPRLDVTDEQMWEDLHSSVACSSLLSMAVIGGRATLAVDQAKVYFRLVEIAGCHPKYECVCFLLLEKMARLGGYDGVESMTCDCAKEFLWLLLGEEKKESIVDKLPLVLTSPGTIRFALKNGWFKKNGDSEIERLRSEAASDFAVRSQSLFPLLLSNATPPFHQDESIRDFLSLFETEEDSDKSSLSKVVRQFAPGIFALSVCLKWGSREDQERGITLLENLKEIVPEEKLEQSLKKGAGVIISEILNWVGSPFVASGAAANEIKESVLDFAGQFGGVGTKDPFHETGLSCLELFLFASNRLSRNRATCRAHNCLRSFEILTTILLSSVQSGGYPPAGFLFFLVSELLTHEYDGKVVEDILLATKKILEALLTRLTSGTGTSLLDEAKQDLKILLVSAIALHERSQVTVLRSFRSSFHSLRHFTLSSMGIDSRVDDDGTISRSALSNNLFSSELSHFSRLLGGKESTGDVCHSILLESTYSLIQWIVENAGPLGIQPSLFSRVSLDSRDQSILERLNERFCCQSLLSNEAKNISQPTPSATLCEIRRLKESTVSVSTNLSSRHGKRFSPPMRLLYLQLESLARSLSEGAMLDATEIMPAVRLLASLHQGKGMPHEMITVSIKCLGEFRPSLERWYSPSHFDLAEDSVEAPSTIDYSLLALESKCVEALALCLRAEDHEKAIVACETLGMVFKRKQLTQFGHLIDGKTSRFLEPFSSRRSTSGSKILSIDRNRASQLKQQFSSTSTTWVDWCWNEEVWRKGMRMPYESWVCLICTGILLRRQESSKIDTSRESLDHFLRMAQMDAGFATTIFPLCILRSLIDESMLLEDTISLEYDTWIGAPDAQVNELISKCFRAVLSACLDCSTDDYRAAGLVLDTLDILRSLTQLRFLQSEKHVPNDRSKKSSQTDSSQGSSVSISADSNSRTTWRGVLYGVVLHVDGLLIARACLKVGRYASAKFYAEAYADARFGGSTKTMHLLLQVPGSYSNSRSDISGFPLIQNNDESVDSSHISMLEDACQFLHVLRECSIKDDGQVAETTALESLISDLSLATSTSDHGWYRASSPFPLDEIRRLGYEVASQKQTSSVVDCLQKLCVPNILQSFVMGQALLNGNESLRPDTSKNFFESCLEDPRLFDVDNSLGAEMSTNFERLTGFFSSGNTCFQEVFLSGISSYAKDDMKTCKVRLEASRERMIGDLVELSGGESTWQGTHRILDRASALHEVDSLINCVGQRDSIMESWISGDAQHEATKQFLFPVSDFTREVALRAALRTATVGPVERMRKLGSIHRQFLWQTADRNRSIGSVDKCEALLARLRGSVLNERRSAEESLRFGILDADIQEARGNKLLAIQTMKQIAQWLGRSGAATHAEEVLAEGLIDLGTRLSTHKAETGEVILKEYFEPGITLAKRHHDRNKTSSSSGNVLCSGFLAQADLLVNLYQIVSSRVSGPEWIKAGKSIIEREMELQDMDRAAQANNSKKKPTKRLGLDRDLSIYRITVRKEVANAREARQKIERSVSDFLLRAAESIIEALAIAGTEATGVPKYVYRLISIWFSPASPNIMNDMQELFGFAVERIPTYRFVPLTNQLFARLGTSDHFSTNLELLTRRMCIEHPYQCVVDMVRFLCDDPGNDKIQLGKMKVAENVLSQVKSESKGFLFPLVEGYKILCDTYIRFASLDPNKLVLDRKRRTRFASLSRECRLDECLGKGTRRRPFPPCILTKPPPIRPGCDYDDVETIVGYDDSFSLAESGLARPKIITCLGTNGARYRQLVKGGDDCRGDCVMEQVFHYVNELFRNQKKLGAAQSMEKNSIITYNIVPLNRKTGVSLKDATAAAGSTAIFLTV